MPIVDQKPPHLYDRFELFVFGIFCTGLPIIGLVVICKACQGGRRQRTGFGGMPAGVGGSGGISSALSGGGGGLAKGLVAGPLLSRQGNNQTGMNTQDAYASGYSGGQQQMQMGGGYGYGGQQQQHQQMQQPAGQYGYGHPAAGQAGFGMYIPTGGGRGGQAAGAMGVPVQQQGYSSNPMAMATPTATAVAVAPQVVQAVAVAGVATAYPQGHKGTFVQM